ncbi:MAG: hypothetical protein R2788_17595 [Saprospiraceae bacterium]
MKKGLLFLGTILCLAAACQQGVKEADTKQAMIEEIHSLEKQLLKTGDASKEKEAALALVGKCSEYAKAYADDPATPGLLFKAADARFGS